MSARGETSHPQDQEETHTTGGRELVDRLRDTRESPESKGRDRALLLNSVETAFAHLVDCRHRMNAADPVSVHRTRIAFKRFRYMVEAMCPVLPELTQRKLEAMKAFQDLLGRFQDTEVFLARTNKLVATNRVDATDVAPLRQWLARRHERQLKQCLRRADVVFKFWPPNWTKEEV
jgi:CHAD domain-containing protein